MPTVEQRVTVLERLMRKVQAVTAALEGFPSDATLTVPHNDSWLFEDNVDGTHPANLRYVISGNVQRIVSARLSIFLAPYRTYNSLTFSNTGTESQGHNHSHSHTWAVGDGTGFSANMLFQNNPIAVKNVGGTTGNVPTTTDSTGESATHTHSITGTVVLGVTEGATATGVTLTFDGGPDVSVNFGGPFTTDQIELDVRKYLVVTKGVKHTIAMQPSGLGRIEAYLRLGAYVTAGSTI